MAPREGGSSAVTTLRLSVRRGLPIVRTYGGFSSPASRMPCILGRHCGPQVHGHAACFARAQPPKTRAPGTRSRTRRRTTPRTPASRISPAMSAPGSYMLILRVREQPVEPGLHQALAPGPGASSRCPPGPAQRGGGSPAVREPVLRRGACARITTLALSDASRNSVVILRLAPVSEQNQLGDGPQAVSGRSDPRGSPSSGVPMLLCGGEGDRHQNCRGNAARNPMPAHSRTRASPLIAVWTARAVNLDARPANSRVDANNTVRST